MDQVIEWAGLVLVLTGVACVCVAAWLMSLPAFLFTVGASALTFGLLLVVAANRRAMARREGVAS